MLLAGSTDEFAVTGPADGTKDVDGAKVDGAGVGGADVDGAREFGAKVDGAAVDGACVDGTREIEAKVDGSNDVGPGDGAIVRGSSKDG